MPTNQSQLIAAIDQAFAGVTLGDGITLHEAEAMDDRLSDEEARERLDSGTPPYQGGSPVGAMPEGDRGGTVSDDDIRHFPSPFAFLDQAGKKFYLPAYLRFAVKYPKEVAADMLVITLTDPSFADQFDLTPEQNDVVGAFLKDVSL